MHSTNLVDPQTPGKSNNSTVSYIDSQIYLIEYMSLAGILDCNSVVYVSIYLQHIYIYLYLLPSTCNYVLSVSTHQDLDLAFRFILEFCLFHPKSFLCRARKNMLRQYACTTPSMPGLQLQRGQHYGMTRSPGSSVVQRAESRVRVCLNTLYSDKITTMLQCRATGLCRGHA